MADKKAGCSCGDIWKDLPPELRPKLKKPSLTRETTCPNCGKVFYTNRKTDYCFDCEKKLGLPPELPA